MKLAVRGWIAVAIVGSLAACGGGGGGGGSGPIVGGGSGGGGGSFSPGVFQPSSGLAAQCAAPRTGQGFPDRQGSVTSENNWLRSWTNELYLWYREVPDLNPANYATEDYFDLLKTSATTASGQPKDKFHFVYDTEEWEALSQSGVEAGYGAQWFLVSGTPPRRIVVAYTEPNTPATAPGVNLTRGVEVTSVDGVDAVNGGTQADVDALNAAFFPGAAGESHSFTIRELSGATRTVTMTSDEITSTPVQNVSAISTASGPVGYMLFNDHIATSEFALINAVNTLQTANITDLVLDIRYNGGGFLDIASSLAYMIAGSATSGRVFERLNFNDKHPTTNPVTGQALAPTPFHEEGNFGAAAGVTLPTLNLPRVYVITGSGTCSASEAVMNGLRGAGVEVIQIGSTTCGKPYGFYPTDNCGTTYFSIQFKGDNAQGFGDYTDGFSPDSVDNNQDRVRGCSVADDFTLALGDTNERRFAAALSYRASNNQTCPAASGLAPGVLTKSGQSLSAAEGVMYKSPWRENRILRQ